MSNIVNFFSGPWGEDKPRTSTRKKEKIIKETIMELKREAEKESNQQPNYNNFDNINPNKFLPFILGTLFVLWLLSGIYKVSPGEEGVVLRFGKYFQTTQPGLNYHLPSPIEEVIKVNTQLENSTEIGFRTLNRGMNNIYAKRTNANLKTQDVSSESLMLTGDQRIVDLDFEVFWRVGNAKDFLFNLEDPIKTIRSVAESAIREVIGTNKLDDALTDGKTEIRNAVQELISKTLDEYKSGILVTGLQLQQVQPPNPVKAAFLDVKAALKDADRMRNEAQGYANDILPKARGEAAQIIQDAQAYSESKIAGAQGEADRFTQQLKAYQQARTITEKRLYIEAMEEILRKSNKIIMSSEAGGNILPYLPLDKTQNKQN